jgi:hypothetical protein
MTRSIGSLLVRVHWARIAARTGQIYQQAGAFRSCMKARAEAPDGDVQRQRTRRDIVCVEARNKSLRT